MQHIWDRKNSHGKAQVKQNYGWSLESKDCQAVQVEEHQTRGILETK